VVVRVAQAGGSKTVERMHAIVVIQHGNCQPAAALEKWEDV